MSTPDDGPSRLSPDDLRRLYREKQEAFGKASLELERRRAQNRLYVSAEEADVEHAGPDQRMIVGPELGFNIRNFHIFTSGRPPGGDRYHAHGDAIKYYIKGGGYELIGDEKFEVRPGDFAHVPANIWHGTINPHDEPLIFLAVQQFPGTYRQVPTPFVHEAPPAHLAPDATPVADLSTLEPWALYRRYLADQMEFGHVALEIQRRREAKRLHIPAVDAPVMQWGPGRHMIVSPELGFDVYTFQVFVEVVAGGTPRSRPVVEGEAVRYYLEGAGAEHVGDERFDVKRGDFLFIPAGVPHATETKGEPLRFLCWQQLPGTYVQVPSPSLPA